MNWYFGELPKRNGTFLCAYHSADYLFEYQVLENIWVMDDEFSLTDNDGNTYDEPTYWAEIINPLHGTVKAGEYVK